MRDAILNFAKQFAFDPVVVHREKLRHYEGFVVAGMGGSHLAADLLRAVKPELGLITHSDYGVPEDLTPERRNRMLFIASSYSGNTEETRDALAAARERDMDVAVISVGGKLLAQAKGENIPYIQLPDTGIQPRSALGLSLNALLRLMGEEALLSQARTLARILNPAELEAPGKALAVRLQHKIPVIYASRRNAPVAYNWKIKFNETGKIPAFCNSIPELNHNAMTGFDVKESTRSLSGNFCFILLKDARDDPRVSKRMDVLEHLYLQQGLSVEVHPLSGSDIFSRLFSSLLLADWAALYTAEQYGLEAEQVPIVEAFKQLLSQ
ncbi:MAG: SIS domain-containing protein [Patescibacteria group bacterium]|nr:SIS domain-containing protein [Patescibacteria group bacterium]